MMVSLTFFAEKTGNNLRHRANLPKFGANAWILSPLSLDKTAIKVLTNPKKAGKFN